MTSCRWPDGYSSLLDEDGSTLYFLQAVVELVSYRGVVWPDSCPVWLIEGTGLQQMFCCLTSITTMALLCMANADFRI